MEVIHGRPEKAVYLKILIQRGGGAVWVTPAFDSKNGLVIFGTGNAAPDFDGTNREGANLFSASIVAVDVATGERVWHFQQVHHDLWDYDQGSAPVIFDMEVNGEKKKVVGAAGKTGWYYLFESKNGRLIHDCPEKSVPTNSLISNSDGLPEKPIRHSLIVFRRHLFLRNLE